MLWGTAYPVIKSSYADMGITAVSDKLMFAGLRFFIAGIMVFAVCLVMHKNAFNIDKRRIPHILLYSLLLTVLQYVFNYIGVGNTTATKTSVLTSLSAFLGVVLAPVFFRDEKLSLKKMIGCLIGITGIAVVNLSFFSGSFSFMGEGFILIATLCNTFGGFVGKKISGDKVFEITAWQLAVGGAVLIIISFMLGAGLSFTAASAVRLLYLSFVSAVAFSLWTLLLVNNDAGRVMIYYLLIPIFGALWSYILLGERDIFDPLNIISLALICMGIILVTSKKSHRIK